MKLRILDNSLRLRLSQTEVLALANEGRVEASIQFPGGTALRYCLETDSALTTIEAHLKGQTMLVQLPTAMAHDWANSNTISLRASNPLTGQEELSILIEKDFKCLTDRPHEDESDLFPHPKEGDIAC